MSTHYTPERVSLLRMIRWRRFIFELIAPIVLILSTLSAWADGTSYAMPITAATWIYVMFTIGRAFGAVRALQVHCVAGFVLFFGQAVYALLAGVHQPEHLAMLVAGLAFSIVAYLVELHARISRLEAPTEKRRSADFPGIYRITCKPNGCYYIGLTERRINERWQDHRLALESGRHHNMRLQFDWSQYRPEQFTWEVLEVITDPAWLFDRERHWQSIGYDTTKCYNPPPVPVRSVKKMSVRRKRTTA